jgi:transposase
VVGAGLRAPGESCDDESGDHAGVRVAPGRKSRRASERDEAKRGAWHEQTKGIEPGRFVWVDETGSNLGLTRTHSRAPRGERAFGDVPQRRGPNRTLITALTLDGFGPGLLLDEAIDRTTFDGYIIHRLAPTLKPGQIVVVDNLKVHYSDRARAAIEAQGAHLWYLPPYSPDLDPIEEASSKVKAFPRSAAPRTLEQHSTAIWAALRTVTPNDAAGWFAHAGYLPTQPRSSRPSPRHRRIASATAPPSDPPPTITLRIPPGFTFDHLW